MNDRKDREIIQVALDTTLSGLQDDPWLVQKVLDDAKGEVKVKKKWSAAMILVMVLILIAAIAVASVVLKEYYEKAFSTQNEKGYYQQWALTDKIALIDRMVKNDFDIDHEMVAKLSDTTLSENEKNALADAIVIGYYGEGHDGALSVVNMMEKDMGEVSSWSLEDKAWVSEQQQQGQYANIEEIHILPQEGDITPEQAIAKANQLLCEQYDISEDEVASYRVTLDLMQLTDDSSAPSKKQGVYQIAYYTPFSDVHPYSVLLTVEGDFLHSSRPYGMERDINDIFSAATEHFSTPQEKAEFSMKWAATIKEAVDNGEDVWSYYLHLSSIDYISPDERFLDQETALANVEASICSTLGWDYEQLKRYSPFISLRRTEKGDKSAEQAIWFFKYIVDAQNIEMYWDQQIPWGVNVAVDARTGKVMLIEETTKNEPFSEYNE